MQKTLFILTKEANENLEYIQGLLLQATEMSEEDKQTIQELIRRCQMFKTQAELVLDKVKVKKTESQFAPLDFVIDDIMKNYEVKND